MEASLTLRPHGEDDLDRLAAMNRVLIEDQGGGGALDLASLRKRFVRRGCEGYAVDLFEVDGEVVGFASHRPDATDDGRPFTFLFQFFIAREHRRGGLGRAAFALLAARRWPPGQRVVLDVRASNPGGRIFWESVGFRPASTRCELFLPAEPPGA